MWTKGILKYRCYRYQWQLNQFSSCPVVRVECDLQNREVGPIPQVHCHQRSWNIIDWLVDYRLTSRKTCLNVKAKYKGWSRTSTYLNKKCITVGDTLPLIPLKTFLLTSNTCISSFLLLWQVVLESFHDIFTKCDLKIQ